MNTFKNVAWMEYGVPDLTSGHHSLDPLNQYNLKTIFVSDNAIAALFKAVYPQARIVQDKTPSYRTLPLSWSLYQMLPAWIKKPIAAS